MVELLIAYGADVNHTLPDGYTTSLYVATLEGHAEVMDLLLGAGAIASVDEDDLVQYPEDQIQDAPKPKPSEMIKKVTSAGSFAKVALPALAHLLPRSLLTQPGLTDLQINFTPQSSRDKIEKEKREASIEISGPRDFKKVSVAAPGAQQEMSKVVIQIEEVH